MRQCACAQALCRGDLRHFSVKPHRATRLCIYVHASCHVGSEHDCYLLCPANSFGLRIYLPVYGEIELPGSLRLPRMCARREHSVRPYPRPPPSVTIVATSGSDRHRARAQLPYSAVRDGQDGAGNITPATVEECERRAACPAKNSSPRKEESGADARWMPRRV